MRRRLPISPRGSEGEAGSWGSCEGGGGGEARRGEKWEGEGAAARTASCICYRARLKHLSKRPLRGRMWECTLASWSSGPFGLLETPLFGEADDSVRRPVCNTEDENCLQSNMDHRPTATGRKSRARQRRRMRDNDCVKHDQEPHSRDAQNEELKDRRRERRPSGTESPSKKKHDATNNTRTQANPRTRTCKNRAVARASPMPTKCSDGNPRHQPQMAKPSARQPLTSPFHDRNPSSHRAAPQPTGRPGRCTLAKTRTTHTLSP